MNDLERELEYELHRVLDPISRMPIPARRPPAQAGFIQRLLGGAGAALALKVATGVVTAAAAVTVAGAATTGSLNPQVWGQRVSTTVESCKDALRPGHHGIGECVSDVAQTNGATVSGEHRQGGSTQGNTSGHGQNQGNANGHGDGGAAGSSTGHGGGNTNPPGKAGKTPGPPPHSPAPGG